MQRNIHRVESSGYRLTIHAMIISSTHANALVDVTYELERALLLYQNITLQQVLLWNNESLSNATMVVKLENSNL